MRGDDDDDDDGGRGDKKSERKCQDETRENLLSPLWTLHMEISQLCLFSMTCPCSAVT